jgi:hypothetical protein
MQPQPPDAPGLRVRVRVGEPCDGPSCCDPDSADLRLLGGGRLRARRGSGAVDYVLPAIPPDADLLHPYLAPAAALVWRWAGREAIHAGAFVGGRGAVVVLGGKNAGKSTTLAWLSQVGQSVLADDLAVVDDGHVLAGPRSIDLRVPLTPPSEDARRVRGGDRTRVTLPEAPRRLPVAGVAVIAWGPRVQVTSVAVEQRWGFLAPQRSLPSLPDNAVSLLELVAAPTLLFTRPPNLTSVAAVGEAMIAAFA